MPPPVDPEALLYLEEKLAHLEASVDELTRARLDQDRALALLHQRLQRAEARLRELAPGQLDASAIEPPPPHY